MSIIKEEYYKGDINLTSEQQENLFAGSDSSWQNIYEANILQMLLGYELYTLYKADLTSDTPQAPQTTRFEELVDGKEFSFDYNGQTVTKFFPGLRDKTTLTSLIAYYVYYQYRNETENFNSGAGQVHSATENSTVADITPKLIYSWNKMIEIYGRIPDCYVDKDLFLNSGSYIHFNSEPSAYNFLLANITTYPEWVFEPLGKQNIFLI